MVGVDGSFWKWTCFLVVFFVCLGDWLGCGGEERGLAEKGAGEGGGLGLTSAGCGRWALLD